MTDGDNIQWLLGPFLTADTWFGSPDRGKVPLGWTVSPALSELAPSVLQRFYADAVPGKDNFVAGPSGVGYCIPELLPNDPLTPGSLAQFAGLTSAFLGKADLHIVNTISNEDCDPNCTMPLLGQPNIDAVFLYFGNAYCGRAGGITWTSTGCMTTMI